MIREPVRAVFFDVGGTLLQPWPSVGAVYARVGNLYGVTASADEMERAFRSAWQDAKARDAVAGLTTGTKEWWRRLVYRTLDQLECEVPAAKREEYFEHLYRVFAGPDAWRVFPDVAPTLSELKQRGLHVGVISNWDARLRPLLGSVGLSRQLDSITISCEVGAEKPDARIFVAALQRAGVPAGDALHIGDNYEEDIQGAGAAGLRAVLLNRRETENKPCRQVHDLAGILRLLND